MGLPVRRFSACGINRRTHSSTARLLARGPVHVKFLLNFVFSLFSFLEFLILKNLKFEKLQVFCSKNCS
jgi:hypothetical protein